jgi:hypothetical protein
MNSKLATLIAIALLVTAPLAATEDTRWLNVDVTEAEGGTNVQVHLPLNLVMAVINSVDVENFHGGKVDLEIADAEIDWPQLLAAIKDAPDGEFVKVTGDDANVLVSKRDGTLYVNVVETEEQNATVNVTLPMSVIDGLRIDENNQIDVAALLTAFDQLPSGDLVTVQSDEANVRVWVE